MFNVEVPCWVTVEVSTIWSLLQFLEVAWYAVTHVKYVVRSVGGSLVALMIKVRAAILFLFYALKYVSAFPAITFANRNFSQQSYLRDYLHQVWRMERCKGFHLLDAEPHKILSSLRVTYNFLFWLLSVYSNWHTHTEIVVSYALLTTPSILHGPRARLYTVSIAPPARAPSCSTLQSTISSSHSFVKNMRCSYHSHLDSVGARVSSRNCNKKACRR
jgi:hypothetical protein